MKQRIDSMIMTGIVVMAMLVAGSTALADTYYVTVGGDDGNGGTNPTTDALASLEKAVELAVDTDLILMGDGTYYLQNYTGVSITNDITLSPISGTDVVILKPKPADGYTGTRRLLIVDSADAVVDGLTLAEAYATEYSNFDLQDEISGYALRLKAGMVTNCVITDCSTIVGNHTVGILGGIMAETEIRNTLVTAGANYNQGTVLNMAGGTATGCVVSNNQVRGPGTVYLNGSGVQLLDSSVAGNTLLLVKSGSTGNAAGIKVVDGARVENCTIVDNYAEAATFSYIDHVAGGVYLYDGAAKLLNCTISGNTTVLGNAGGVHIASSSAQVENCLITGNYSLGGASGGVYMTGALANLLNCTIYGNVADSKTFGHGLTMSAGTAKNLILYANGFGEAALIGGNLVRTGGTVSYSCVTPATDADGAGNIEGNPHFADAANGDFHLLFGSICRDSGETIATLTNDIVGVLRPQGSGYDMGCYEAVPSSEPECMFNVVSGAQGAPSLTTSFSTVATPDTGIVNYTWTTTDGVTTNTETVTTPSWSHTFTGYGRYDVSLKILYDDTSEANYTEQDVVRVLPTTAYVDLDGAHIWPFETLLNASTNFQEAIDAVSATVASPGTVKVQPGIYGEANGLDASHDYIVLLARPVRLIGQGETATDTVIDGNHTRRLMRILAEGSAVENLTLSRGANLMGVVAKGFGLEIGVGTVTGCIVTNGWSPDVANFASPEAMVLQGGGMVSDTDICGNRTASTSASNKSGATVQMTGGTMANCRIFDNIGRNPNGLVYISGTGTCLTNSSVFGNTLGSTRYYEKLSAGVTLADGAQLVGCEITDNVCETYSYSGAGGLNLAYGDATVRNCVIRGNSTANGESGGVLMGPNTVVANCLIVDNATGATLGLGGGVAMNSATARLLNCTVAANTNRTAATGQGVYMTAGAVTNCVVYGNGPAETRFTTNNLDFTGGTVAFTLAMPQPEGDGNIGADPLFKDPDNGNYRPRGTSPVRRAGAVLPEITHDLDGQPRRLDRSFDLGCYLVSDMIGTRLIIR